MKFFFLLFIFFYHLNSIRAESAHLEQKYWTSTSYDNIPPNLVSYSNNSIIIKVSNSASPLIYKLERPRIISSFRVKGKLIGIKKREQHHFDEDSILKVGLVVVGNKKLTGVKKIFATDWIKKLFSLVPEDSGVDKIIFFNVTNRKKLLNNSRNHPKSELISEKISYFLEKEGSFDMEVKVEPVQDTAALWISIDGDDSKSTFEVQIDSIVLN